MARITGEIDNSTLKRLRLYLIETEGSTKKMGPFLDEIINKELDKHEYPVTFAAEKKDATSDLWGVIDGSQEEG